MGALATITTFQEIISTSNNVAEQNNASLAKALQVADDIIKEIDQTEIKNTPGVKFLDQNCLSYLQKAAKTQTAMNERRKPITQAFDQVRKYFTDQENQLSKTGEKIVRIQKFRNDLATFIAKEEEKLEKERQLIALKEQERIECRSFFKTTLVNDLVNSLDMAFNELNVIFESAKLSDISLKKDEIKNFNKAYKPVELKCTIRYITIEEHDEILRSVLPSEIAKNESEYARQLSEKIQYYLDRFESKKEELLQLASANALEKEKIEKDAKERAEKEAEERKKQLLTFSAKQQTSIEGEKTEASLDNLFNQNYTEQTSSVKKVLQIEVLNPSGYGQIFMFWFEREGKKLSNEKIEKKSIAQMKKFCEDTANANGEIIDSSSLVYKEVVTSLNK